VDDDTDVDGNVVADETNGCIGEHENGKYRYAHGQGGIHASGNRKGGTDPEYLKGNRVVVENRSVEDLFGFGG